MVWVRPLDPPSFDPYAAPNAVATATASGGSSVRSGAFLVLFGEVGRSLLWRMNSALNLAYPRWPDPMVSNRIIKVLGAVVILWGGWRLTDGAARSLARVAPRLLLAVALGGHLARLLLLVGSRGHGPAPEAATNLVDAVALSACTLCLVPVLRAGARRGWAVSAVFLAAAYLFASIVSTVDFLGPKNWHFALLSTTVLRPFLSLTMLALGAWAGAIAAHLPSSAASR
jgi:hypothetical protein